MGNPARLEVTLRKSLIGEPRKTKASVRGLGLRRIGQVTQVEDNRSNRGMIKKAQHLLDVREDVWDWSALTEMERFSMQRQGQALSRIPMNYAVPILIADTSLPADDANITSGTGSLVRTPEKKLCVTNWHVIDAFRQKYLRNKNVTLHVGQFQVHLDQKLIDEDEILDLAVLDFDDVEPADFQFTKDINKGFLEFKGWPPVLPKEGSFVMFGGFPRDERLNADRNIIYGFVSAGAAMAYSVSDTNIVCRVEEDRAYIDEAGFHKHPSIDLAGMSGGPVLVERTTDTGIVVLDLVGFIYEHIAAYDALRIRPATYLNIDGTLRRFDSTLG